MFKHKRVCERNASEMSTTAIVQRRTSCLIMQQFLEWAVTFKKTFLIDLEKRIWENIMLFNC